MRFELLTLGGTIFSGEVEEVGLKSAAGQISVLPHHEPLNAVVLAGPVMVRQADSLPRYFAAFGGLLEVTADRVRLLADEAEPGEDIIEAEVQAAFERAEAMKAHAESMHEIHEAGELAGRHAVRLEVARLHRRHRERRQP